MKRLLYAIFGTFFIFYGCGFSNEAATSFDTASVLLIDRTDKQVRITEGAISKFFHIDENRWQGLEIRLSTISDIDFNSSTIVKLEPEIAELSNSDIRDAKIARFKNDLRIALSRIYASDSSKPNSVIYRTVAKCANWLAGEPAKKKTMISATDLYENGDSASSFYNPEMQGLIKDKPSMVAQKLEQDCPLCNLNGMNLYFLYAPKGFSENEKYLNITKVYKTIFEQHGAILHFDSSLE